MAKSTPSFSLGLTVSSGFAGTLRSSLILSAQNASKSCGAGIAAPIFSGATAAPSARGFAPGTASVISTYTMPGSSSFASILAGCPG